MASKLRQDSPYSSETEGPCPEGFGYYGETNWCAQNEGSKVKNVGLYLDPEGDE